MRRMIYIWVLLIVVVCAIGFFHSEWSIVVNNWVQVAFIVLLLLLGNEIGLYFWRRKMIGLSQLLKNSQVHSVRTEQENHYVPPTSSSQNGEL